MVSFPGAHFSWARDGAVVRALASQRCGPGSTPGTRVICGLSFCWFSTLLRGFFSGVSGFPPSAKTDRQLIRAGCWRCYKVMHGPYSGCQRRLHMLSVRPCRAASLLYFAWAISETVIIMISMQILLTGFQTLHEVHCIQHSRKKSFLETFKVDQSLCLKGKLSIRLCH